MLTPKSAAMEICTSSLYLSRTGPDFRINFRIFKNRFALGGVVFKSSNLSKAGVGWQVLRALRDDRNKGNRVEGWDPGLEIQVPSEQRPVNELAALKGGPLYSWAELNGTQFVMRLGGLWLFFFTILSGPIAAGSFEPSHEPLKFFLAAGAGSLFVVSLFVLRIYLGWSYVGDRLLSAVIPYEETGWYDGQLWVKPPEVLARDRLLGSYKVKPVTDMLKQTLICSGVLLATTVSLFLLVPPQEGLINHVVTSQKSNSETLVPDRKNKIRKEDLLNLPLEVMDDDKLAEAAAKAANGRPVYCTDRYYRALAGGQYCRWDDLRK